MYFSAAGSTTKNPPLIQPSCSVDFSLKWRIRSPSNSSAPNRAGGRTAVSVTSAPRER